MKATNVRVDGHLREKLLQLKIQDGATVTESVRRAIIAYLAVKLQPRTDNPIITNNLVTGELDNLDSANPV